MNSTRIRTLLPGYLDAGSDQPATTTILAIMAVTVSMIVVISAPDTYRRSVEKLDAEASGAAAANNAEAR